MATAKTTKSKAAPAKTTAVAKRTSGAVVDAAAIREKLKAQAEKLADKIAPPTGVAIRITQDKKFILPNGVTTSDPLELVVVDFVSRNEYYEGEFDKDNLTPPACFAIHPEPKQLVPSTNSPARQADSCAECPMNVFGSATRGDGKACKNTRLLAVLPPDADENTPLWTLKVSPTALRNFDGFVSSVARTFQTPPVGVVVTVGFNPDQTYASLVFTDPQINENVAVHASRIDEAAELLMTEPDVSQYEPPAPKAAKRPPAKKAPAKR